MDTLYRKSDRLLANTSTEIIREKMDEIHWNSRLVSIMGAKVIDTFLRFQERILRVGFGRKAPK